MAVKWDPVVILSFVQMVGHSLSAYEAMDDPIHHTAIRKHHPCIDYTLCYEWTGHIDNGDPVVNEIAKYYTGLSPLIVIRFEEKGKQFRLLVHQLCEGVTDAQSHHRAKKANVQCLANTSCG